LHNIVDLGLDKVKQGADTPFRCHIDFDGAATDRSNRLSDEIHIYFCGVSKTNGSLEDNQLRVALKWVVMTESSFRLTFTLAARLPIS